MHDLQQLQIRHVTREDATTWVKLRRDLWPDGAEDHAPEIAQFFAGTLPEPVGVLVVETQSRTIVAFAELSIRADIPGMQGQRVGYVEGLYVIPELRHRGIARELLHASRNWAREQGCTACASDRAGRIVVDRSF